MKASRTLFLIIILLISFPIFIWLESGFSIKSVVDLINPFIFTTSLVLSIGNFFRRILLTCAFILLIIMVAFYLFWQIDISSWLGSLGMGILTIYVLGYLPDLVKKGYVEKI